jgi:hypothetical protein
MIQLNTTVGAAPGPSPDQTALQGPPEDQALRTLINAKDQLQDPRPVAPDAEPGARFLAPGFAPQGIGELAEYRKANAERRRLGLSPLPELDLDKMPPDQPLPRGLAEVPSTYRRTSARDPAQTWGLAGAALRR